MKGFTLIEIAVVLAVVALLLGGLLVPVSARIDRQNRISTEASMEIILEALEGYAATNGYLPCPAVSSSNGAEDRSAGICNKRSGFVPWVALGTPKADAWGNLFQYSVTPAFSSAIAPFSFNAAEDITIKTRDSGGNLVNLSNLNSIPAVILSFGRNGFGGTSQSGIAQTSPPAANGDEITNSTSSTVFVSRTEVDDRNAANGAFDDIVDWVPPYVLMNRMVQAGRLP